MTPHQTIAVLVRLFAIWLAIYFARLLPSFHREMVETDDPNAMLAAVVIAVLVVLVVLFLWFFPRTIAWTLLDSKSLAPAEPSSPDTWLAVGCALIGLWLIIPALARLIYNLSMLYLAQRTPNVDTSNLSFTWIYYVVEIAFGVWLVLGARGARKLFWWARNAE